MTTPATPVQDAVREIAKTAIYKKLLPLLAAKAIAKAPWLGASVINPLFMFVLEWFLDVFYDETILLSFFGVTDFLVGNQRDRFEKEKQKLADKINETIQHNGSLSNEDLQKISDDFDKRLGELINYDT